MPGRARRPESLAEKPGQAAILQDPPVGLAARAVVDRVLLEVDARERRAALRTRLAEAVVDAVDLPVGGSALAELGGCGPSSSASESLKSADASSAESSVVRRVRRELGVVEDLVRPGPADPGDEALVAEERVEAARVGSEDLRELLVRQAVRLRPEVGELLLDRRGGVEADLGAFLRSGFGEDERAPVLELEPERWRLGLLVAVAQVAEPACAHQVDVEDELPVLGREEEVLRPALGAREPVSFERESGGRRSSASRCARAPPWRPGKRGPGRRARCGVPLLRGTQDLDRPVGEPVRPDVLLVAHHVELLQPRGAAGVRADDFRARIEVVRSFTGS